MIHSARSELEIRRTMPATLQAAEEFFAEFRRWHQALLGGADYFAAELLLREALTNAVAHGSHADPGKQVRCVSRLNGRRLLIAVQDDGDGFDWRAAWDRPANLSDCSGRGVEILRKYGSRVRYNGRGNAVTILRRIRSNSRIAEGDATGSLSALECALDFIPLRKNQ
jgi:anti-sigma regulatory factor (Ser/Thr protein kinase)